MKKELGQLKAEMEAELRNNILPYWMKAIDEKHGGYLGRIDGHDVAYADADKGGVLNARILWTFSSAYRVTGDAQYLTAATRSKDYLLKYFYDNENGGIYWSVDCDGNPKDSKKQIYALGFAIYGLSEYHRATGDKEALDKAIELFHSIEKYSFDTKLNGYFEAFDKTWGQLGDVRLSDKDDNDQKTMNTHLHILEPYTNLYRVWKSPELKAQLANLIRLFLDKILDKETGHLNLFFDEQWQFSHHMVSYGHDIEASWLLYEAAAELGDPELMSQVEAQYLRIADASAEGLQSNGGLIYEYDKDSGHCDHDFHLWVQAESVVGNFNAFQFSGDGIYFARSYAAWTFIKNHIIDKEKGEWHWSMRQD